MNNPLPISEIFSSIQGEGLLAGRRQIFIRLTECNLGCRYCDTLYHANGPCRIETQPGCCETTDVPQPVSLRQVLDLVADWDRNLTGAHHSVSFTGGEPLLSAEVLAGWLPEVRRILPIHLETNGTMHLALERVIEHLDFISMDIKLPSTSGCTEHLWDLHRRFLETAVGTTVSVKVVVGNETTREEIEQTCAIIASCGSGIPLFLQPVTLPHGNVDISAAHLLRLQAHAAARLDDVRVIPQMHKLLGVL